MYVFTRENSRKLVEKFESQIKINFSDEEIEQLAKETNFVQRSSKISGNLFLELLVFNNENLKYLSLNDMAITLKEKHRVDVTKQSLQERFNSYSLLFLKKFLEKIIKDQIVIDSELGDISYYNRILIKDSVCFQIDDSFSAYYPGSGGSGSKASVRIQFEYDLLTGTINDLSINAFNDQDAKNSEQTIELVEEGDLVIRDLAYMGLKVLQRIKKKQAFFICRLNPTTKVYENNGAGFVELQFANLLKYMKKNNIKLIEKSVYLGQAMKVNCRLIIGTLPQNVVNERIRKARENNKKKGRGEPSDEYKSRCHFNLFVTNTDPEQVSAKNVILFYKLRWQIELIFKIWKSLCGIEKVKKVNRYRLECYIYAKLIFIALGWKIVWQTAKMLFSEKKKALSYYKAFKTLLRHKLDEFYSVLKSGKNMVMVFLFDFYEISSRHHLLERKRNKPNSLEILLGCLNVNF